MLRVAVLFSRLGPYHFARLQAASQLVEVVAIEFSSLDPTYTWDEVTGEQNFRRCSFNGDPQSKPESNAWLSKTLNEIQPAVVLVAGWSHHCSLSALRWCCGKRAPAVMMSESTQWDEKRRPWKEWVKRRVVGLCSAALVGGQPHADYIVQLGMARARVFLGYDAVDNDYFAQSTERVRSQSSVVRGQLGFPDNYFLASARFVEKKNLPRLVQAYARYRTLCGDQRPQTTDDWTTGPQDHRTTGPRDSTKQPEVSGQWSVVSSPFVSSPVVPWSLVVLGDGPLRSSINHQLSTLNLPSGRVHLPGFKQYPELPAYYGLASAFIHASTTEPWGLVVNEAMASGLPVLVSNRCGCAADLVQEGVNGFTFDPCNVEQLAQLMLKISAFQLSSLSAFGSESRRIVADWGPERFANGLKQAVECASRVGQAKPTLLQRMILKAHISR